MEVLPAIPYAERVKNLFIIGIVLLASSSTEAKESPLKGKIAAMSMVTGLPQLIGPEFRYVQVPWLQLGVSFGAFPIDNILQNKINYQSIDVGSGYNILLNANYSIVSLSTFMRFLPFKKIWFISLHYSLWNLSADASGDLVIDGTDLSLANAISADLDITQNLFAISTGVELVMGKSFFVDFGIGLNYLFPAQTSLDIGSNSLLINFVLDEIGALDDVEDELRRAVNENYNNIKFLPAVYFNIGFAF